MEFHPYAIKRILEDYGTNWIIDFGGRHSVYQESELLNQVSKMLKSYANIVLILPSRDFHESLRILDERRGMRHLLYGFDANSLMLRHKSNYEFAKHIHFNKKKAVKESSKEILNCLSLR